MILTLVERGTLSLTVIRNGISKERVQIESKTAFYFVSRLLGKRYESILY